MCPSIPTRIHPYMSKLRLLLETDDENNELCLGGPVHAQDHGPGCSVAGVWNGCKAYGGGSYCMPIQDYNMR